MAVIGGVLALVLWFYGLGIVGYFAYQMFKDKQTRPYAVLTVFLILYPIFIVASANALGDLSLTHHDVEDYAFPAIAILLATLLFGSAFFTDASGGDLVYLILTAIGFIIGFVSYCMGAYALVESCTEWLRDFMYSHYRLQLHYADRQIFKLFAVYTILCGWSLWQLVSAHWNEIKWIVSAILRKYKRKI